MITTTLHPHHLKPSILPFLLVNGASSTSRQRRRPKISHFTPQNHPKFPSLPLRKPPHRRLATITACAASDFEIDMVRTREGVFAAKPKKVVVLWDLDNKPPRGPPYDAAVALKKVAQHFGEVVEISAYANRHAFIHLPQWVVQERREMRQRDVMERKGISVPSEPYVCSVCGRKCKTHLDLKKHFRQLHERERQKKVNRMNQLKGKKRQRFKERFISGNEKYNEAARTLLSPKTGYGLASELRRAGVFVKTVEDKPQAADWALKRQVQHSMSRGIDWMLLISDDSDFSDTLRKAREANLGTVVVGDGRGVLGKNADLWVPWNGVQNGEIGEKDLVVRKRREFAERSDQRFSVSEFDGGKNGAVMEELFGRMELDGSRNSAFSEGEEEDEDDWLRVEIRNSSKRHDDDDSDGGEMGDYMLDSEDEDGFDMYE